MNNWLVIGILAGIASGVLYFSAAAGNLAGMMLASFASFPLFVAGLGWGIPTVLLGVCVLLVGFAFSNRRYFMLMDRIQTSVWFFTF